MDKLVNDPSKDVMVSCPNCKANNKLGACLKEVPQDDLTEVGLQCPDCGFWTHSFWTNQELKARADRLEQIRFIYQKGPTEARYNNYNTARQAYAKAFEEFQTKMKGKDRRKEVQPA